jgi:drug/metabolite transporter (DMT)-like permease
MFLPLIKKKSFRINLYRLKNQRILFIRAIFLSLATTFWFLGAPSCPIVNLTIISFSIPMILLFLSALLLKEKIGFRRKIYNLFGLIGILTIVNFDASTSNFFDTLIIFLGAIFFSLFGIYSKKCATQGDDVLAVVCLTAFYSSLILLPFTIYYWTSIDIYQILIYIFLGFLANLNSYFLLKAYQLETASFLAQFMYLEMIFSILTGTFIFNEQIYATTLIGSLFIVMTNTFATLDQKP